MVTLKKCTHEGCTAEFPAHYFHDRCPAHQTAEDNKSAEKRAKILVPGGAALILTLASATGMPADEVSQLRDEFIANA
ncbi:MAG TPA: hypothetical protein VJJ02_05235 [Candidatus Paceibacterota bacterium]